MIDLDYTGYIFSSSPERQDIVAAEKTNQITPEVEELIALGKNIFPVQGYFIVLNIDL